MPEVTPGSRQSDQPGIVYSFEDDDDRQLRKLIRSGYGDLGPSPGDVIEIDSTKSDPDTQLPEREIPGRRRLQQDDCGDEMPAFACSDCGSPIYVGRTCGSPLCRRCWPSAVKDQGIKHSSQLEALKIKLHSETGKKKLLRHHLVASPPDGFRVDSDQPLKRSLDIIKELLRRNFGVKNFYAVFHPYRIKQEYRKDQYEHKGEPGEGDMTWADVIDSDDWEEYVVYEPHFHIFCVAEYIDISLTESLEAESGWIFKRIQNEDGVSVEDLPALAKQITYCLSHAMVMEVGNRNEIATRQKGQILHNEISYAPESVVEEVTAAICEAAPRLLGVRFANTQEGTCNEEIPTESESTDPIPADGGWHRQTADDLDLGSAATPSAGTGAGSGQIELPEDQDEWTGTDAEHRGSSTTVEPDSDDRDEPETAKCGGDIVPIRDADQLLEDDEWRSEAEYVEALEAAYDEWQRLDEQYAPDEDGAPPPPDGAGEYQV